MGTAVVQAATQGLTGFAIGNQSAMTMSQEREIRQGGNHLMAGMVQAGHVSALAMAVDQLANFIPVPAIKVVVKIFTNLAPLLSIPATIMLGVFRDRQYYPFVAQLVNQHIWTGLLPESIEEMSPWVVNAIDFTAEHLGEILQVAVLASGVALIALGSYVMGGFVVGAITYYYLDQHLQIIPRKVSLFMETYMPIVTWVGVLIAGNPVLQVMAAIALITYIPGVYPWFIEQVDKYVRKGITKFLGVEPPGASIAEIDGPLIEQKGLSKAEIDAILGGSDRDFESNPAHCSKQVIDLSGFPRDTNWNKLVALFERTDWAAFPWRTESHGSGIVRAKLLDDDRFMDMLEEKFPSVGKEALKQGFDRYVDQLARAERKTIEQFAADWIRTQLQGLVDALNGDRRIEGRQQDLADAMESISLLIPYMEAAGDDGRIDVENIMLSLAVEGGYYCGRGVKRVAAELVGQILYDSPAARAQRTGDPDRDFELEIRQALQDQRRQIVDEKYRWIMDEILHAPDRIRDDVHGHDIYRLFLSKGFYPLTPYEEHTMNTSMYLVWELYNHGDTYIPDMLRHYEAGLDGAFATVGEARFAGYMQRMIEASGSLTHEQKDELLERLAGTHEDYGYMNPHAWHRLALIMMGVLRPKKDSAAMRARTEASRMRGDRAAPAPASVPVHRRHVSFLGGYAGGEAAAVMADVD